MFTILRGIACVRLVLPNEAVSRRHQHVQMVVYHSSWSIELDQWKKHGPIFLCLYLFEPRQIVCDIPEE